MKFIIKRISCREDLNCTLHSHAHAHFLLLLKTTSAHPVPLPIGPKPAEAHFKERSLMPYLTCPLGISSFWNIYSMIFFLLFFLVNFLTLKRYILYDTNNLYLCIVYHINWLGPRILSKLLFYFFICMAPIQRKY